MELRRNGTINTHSFSRPWPTDNIKKRGGEFQIFPSSNLRVNTQISIPTQALKLLSGGNTFGWRTNKKKSEELVKKRGGRVADYMQGEEG
jgi:hypothetical protein